MTEEIGIEDFERVDIRVGTVVAARRSRGRGSRRSRSRSTSGPRSGPSTAPRRSPFTTARRLVGRQVAAVVNFPPRRIAGFVSEVLTLGFPDAVGEVVLIEPERAVPNGARLF